MGLADLIANFIERQRRDAPGLPDVHRARLVPGNSFGRLPQGTPRGPMLQAGLSGNDGNAGVLNAVGLPSVGAMQRQPNPLIRSATFNQPDPLATRYPRVAGTPLGFSQAPDGRSGPGDLIGAQPAARALAGIGVGDRVGRSAFSQDAPAPSAADFAEPASARLRTTPARSASQQLSSRSHRIPQTVRGRSAGLLASTQASTADAIATAAYEFGMDPDELTGTAFIESTLDPNARRGGHLGIFQFSDDAWKDAGGDPNKRYDIREQVRALKNERNAIDKRFFDRFGRHPDPFESYFIHQQGWGGAMRIMGGDLNESASRARSPGFRGAGLSAPIRKNMTAAERSQYGAAGPSKASFFETLRTRYDAKRKDGDAVLAKVRAMQDARVAALTLPTLQREFGGGITQQVDAGIADLFGSAMRRTVDRYRKDQRGAKPDAGALSNMADTLLLPGHWTENGVRKEGRLFQAPAQTDFFYDMDANTQARLSRTLRDKFGRDPTAYELGSAYALEHAQAH